MRAAGLLAALALLVVLACAARPALAQPETPEGEPGFVQLTVNNTDSLPFFRVWFVRQNVPYLHFDSLMQATEIPATWDPSLQSAIGFLADGTTRFTLNVERGVVEVGAQTYPLAPDAYVVVQQELFVRYDALPQWLPLRVRWDLEAYEVLVETAYTLPSVARKQRRERREELEARRAAEAEAVQAATSRPPWFDPGMFELSTSARGGEGYAEQGLVRLRGVHRVLKGDLEYSLTDSVMQGTNRGFETDYARLRYYDPLHTWEATLGDTFATFSPLVLDAVSFRGASYYTGGRRLRYGRTTLLGTAPPGSEVDLYRQGVLVDFTNAGDDGFYRFRDVPLTVASTLFEIHVFTPEGRRLVEFQQVSSSEEMLPPGRIAAQAAAGSSREAFNDFRIAGGEVRYGLFPTLTVGAYGLQLQDYRVYPDVIDEHRSAALLALWRPAPWLLLQVEEARDMLEEGKAHRQDAFLAFRYASLELDHRAYSGAFAPPARTRGLQFLEAPLAEAITRAELHTRVLDTNANVRSRLTDFGLGRELWEHRLRLDRRIVRNLTAFLTLERDRFDGPETPAGGQDVVQLLSTYRFTVDVRLDALLRRVETLEGDSSRESRLTLEKNYRFASPWAYRASYVTGSADDYVAGALGYLFPFNLRMDAQADTDGHWAVQVGYTLPFRVTGDGFQALPPDTFGRAGVTGTVFLDQNGDGTPQPDETPLPDVTVLAPGLGGMVTDSTGTYGGWGLPTTEPSQVQLDLFTADALFIPTRDRIPVLPRPGQLVRVDIPLVAAGGLEGEVRDPGGAQISPLYGTDMVLHDADGELVARAPVEWDGLFVMENLRPGTYTLAPDPDGLARKGLSVEPAERTVELPGGTQPAWRSGLVFRIRR